MKKSWFDHRVVRLGGAIVLVVALASSWIWWRARPDGRLHIIAPALAGDALLIITPHGDTLLVDGGRDADGMATFVGERIPFWRRSIDALVLTRADDDHLPGALALARRYSVRQALLPSGDDAQMLALRTALTEESASINPAAVGQTLLVDGVRVTVLQAATRDGGATLAVQYGAFTALLAPMVDDAQASKLLANAPPAAIVWWPWTRPDDRAIAEKTRATTVLYSESTSGRPDPRTLFERGSTERRLLHEDVNGTIEISTDGTQLWIETER